MVPVHVIMELTEGLWQEDPGQGSDDRGMSVTSGRILPLGLRKAYFHTQGNFQSMTQLSKV